MSTTEHDYFKDGIRYVLSKNAAKEVGLVADYVSRMCRSGQVRGVRHGGSWYVDPDSLSEFLKFQEAEFETFKRRQAIKGKERLRSAAQYRRVLTVSPHPYFRAEHDRRQKTRKHISRVARVGALGIAMLALVSTSDLTQQKAKEKSVDQFAAASSVPLVDSLANSVFNTLCPIFGSCPKETTGSVAANVLPVQQRPSQPELSTSSTNNKQVNPEQTTSQQIIQNITQPIRERIVEKVVREQIPVAFTGVTLSQLSALESSLISRIENISIAHSPDTARIFSLLSAGQSGGGSTVSNITNVNGVDNFIELNDAPSALVAGDILYADAADHLAALSPTTNGLVLKLVGGFPSWAPDVSGGGGAGAWATSTDDLFIYPADPTDVVVVGNTSTTTTGSILEVAGNSLLRGTLTTFGVITTPRVVATSTLASTLPYASTTAITATTASTTNLTISSVSGSLLKTDTFGNVSAAVAGVDYAAAGSSGFATTSANYWKSQSDFFSTTSANHLLSTYDKGYFFSTTSADYWKLANSFFSTTSVNFWASGTNLFSTTSADAFLAQRTLFSTTSAEYWKSVTDLFSTSSATYFLSQQNVSGFSTTSANYFVQASTSIPKTYAANTFLATNVFGSSTIFTGPVSASNASTTNLTAIYASSTNLYGSGLTNCAMGMVLTWSNGRFSCTTDQTTPGANDFTWLNHFNTIVAATSSTLFAQAGIFASSTSYFSAANTILASTTYLTIASTPSALLKTDSVGNVVAAVAGVDYLTANSAGFSTTSADYWKTVQDFFSTSSTNYLLSNTNLFSTTSANYYLSQNGGLTFSTSSSIYFVNASTSIPKTYTANTYSLLQTFGNASSTILSADTFCLSNDCRTSWPSSGASFGYPFPNNSTSTQLTFAGGIVANGRNTITFASSTAISSDYASSTRGFFGTLSVGTLSGVLRATAGAISTGLVSLASDITGILAVTNGGTGWDNLAAGALLYGNGTSAIATTSAGLPGQVLALLGGVPTWIASTTYSGGLVFGGGNVTLSGAFDKGFFFSTTSADAFLTQRNLFSTTSADYWRTVADLFSTTSTTYFVHSSTTIPKTYSNNIFTGSNIFSGTSTITFASSTALTAGNLFSTNATLGNATSTSLAIANIASGSLLKVTTGGSVLAAVAGTDYAPAGNYATFGYLFPNNATTTLLTFSGGLTTTYASTTAISSTGSAYFATSGGNVGIGTTTPQFKLTVQDGSDTGIAIYNASASYQGWNLLTRAANGDFAITQPGTAERLRITTSGNVGIGTTTPSKALTVYSSTNVASVFGDNTAALGVGQLSSAGAIQAFTNTSANAVANLTIQPSGGNVGIGTTSPSAKLQVLGTSEQFRLGYDSTNYTSFTEQSNGDMAITHFANLYFGNYSGTNSTSINGNTGAVTVNSSGNSTFTGNGNVGLGTTSPLTTLHVGSGSSVPAGELGTFMITSVAPKNRLAFGVDTSGTQYGWIQSVENGVVQRALSLNPIGGNVGIGTTSPSQKLTVSDSSAANILLEKTGTNAKNWYLSSGSAGASKFSISDETNYALTIDGSRNVGIGTTSPLSLLHTYSTIVAPGSGEATGVGQIRIDNGASALSSAGGLEFKIAGDTNGYGSKIQALNSGGSQLVFAGRQGSATWSEYMRINASGNVGIGSTTPMSALAVTGSGVFTGTVQVGATGAEGTAVALNGGGYNNTKTVNIYYDTSYDAGLIQAAFAGTANKNLLLNSAGGNVGIGTTSPGYRLDVYNAGAEQAALFTGSSGNTTQYWHGANIGIMNKDQTANAYTGLQIYSSKGDAYPIGFVGTQQTVVSGSPSADLVFGNTTGGSILERMRILANGNLGVGTASPGNYRLAVEQSNSGGNIMSLRNTHASGLSGIDFLDESGVLSGYLDTDNAGNTMTMQNYQGGSFGNILLNPSGGNVGIGTANPLADLQVQGDNGASYGLAQFVTSDYGDGVAGSGLRINTGAATGNTYTTLSAFTGGFTGWGNLALQAGGGSVGIGTTSPSNKLHVSSGDTSTLASIQVSGRSPTFIAGNNSTNALFMGYVTTATDYVGGSSVGDTFLFPATNSGNLYIGRNGGGNGPVITVNNSTANVGIGVSPSFKLDVAGDTTARGTLRVNSGSEAVVGAGGLDAGDIVIGNPSYGSRHDTSILFWTRQSAQRLVTDFGGFGSQDSFYFTNYGSATTSPGVILAGTNAGKSYFSGNVGIASSTPSAKLGVAGSIESYGSPDINVAPIGNSSIPTNSSLLVQGTTAQSNKREFLANFGLTSNTGSGATYGSFNDHKVTIYGAVDASAGSGSVWALNTVTRLNSGFSSNMAAHGYELDFDNSANDWNGNLATTTIGLSITGAGTKRSTSAMLISGPSTPIWNYGIMIANNSVKEASFFDLGVATTSIYVAGAHTYDAVFNGGGLVGIGTASPDQGKVEVKGGSVCVDTNNDDNATSCIASESDARLKENIVALSASSSLSTILSLNPVSFDWRSHDPEILQHYPLIGRFASSTHSIGLIAQEVMPVLPEALSLETVGDSEVQYYQLDYTKFIPHLIGAIKEIATISGAFKDSLVVWLGSASNGIEKLFAKEVYAQRVEADELCAHKSDGSKVCVNGDQLASLLAGAAAPSSPSTPLSPSATLSVNGNDPAEWTLNTPWQDNLGALFTYNGNSETIYSTSTIDVTLSGTTTIDYWAVVPATQEVLHATRDIVIPSSQIPPIEASSTPETSSDTTASSTSETSEEN